MTDIYNEELANGVTVKVTDQSRMVAGDRWYIKLVCAASLSVEDGMIKGHDDDGVELLAMIRESIGSKVGREFVQERNFVDAGEKDEVTAELLARIKDNINGYLALPKFPPLFLDSCFDEKRLACLAMINRSPREQADEDDGPADFSACFKD